MSTVPHQPQGSDDEANFTQKIFERVWKKLNFINTPTCSWNKTMAGISANVKPSKGGPPVKPIAVSEFLFIAVFADYIIGQNVQTQAVIPIARPWDHRNSQNTVAYIDGEQWTYTYPQNHAGNALAYISRTATRASDGYFELQRIRRPYLTVNANNPPQKATRILAIQLPYTILMTPNPKTDDNLVPQGSAVTWIEVGPARMWCKKGNQNTP